VWIFDRKCVLLYFHSFIFYRSVEKAVHNSERPLLHHV
jgi:hypothetical protein